MVIENSIAILDILHYRCYEVVYPRWGTILIEENHGGSNFFLSMRKCTRSHLQWSIYNRICCRKIPASTWLTEADMLVLTISDEICDGRSMNSRFGCLCIFNCSDLDYET